METTADARPTTLSQSKQIHGGVVLVLILLAAFLFAETISSLKEYRFIGSDGMGPSMVTVSGEGEVFAVPDTAVFSFSVMHDAATAGEVQGSVKGKVDNVLGAVKEKGVQEADIRTIAYELHPKYELEQARCANVWPCPPGKQVQKGFTLTQTIEVKVRDLNKAGEVIGVATEKGATNVSGLTFTVSDEDKKRDEARKAAIDEAREQAEVLAGDLGVTLVRIINFSEGSDTPVFFNKMSSDAFGLGSDMAQTAASVPAGENRIVSNVSVTYEIR